MSPQPIAVTGGLIQGVPSRYEASVTTYLGVPYAAPPIGQHRFGLPQPVKPWTGVQICDTPANVPPQRPPPAGWYNALGGLKQSEDCLYLNIWVPERSDTAAFPVYMWMHGGAFRAGSCSDPNYDGSGLAQKGVIVVDVGFRLGIFGWLAHPELTKEFGVPSGNQGYYDCIQALRWIQDNIGAFGGDKGCVTIGGQSSGSAMTGVLLYSPLTKGLFHRAIFQSGARYPRDPQLACLAPSYRSYEQAEKEGVDMLGQLGVRTIAELREYDDLEKLIDIGMGWDDNLWGPPPLLRSVLDGYLFPKGYEATLSDGPPNDVPILTGQNHDESGVYTHKDFNMADLRECVQERYGLFAERFHQLYAAPNETPGDGPLAAWNAAARDNSRVNPSLYAKMWSKHCQSPVYVYYLTAAPPWYKSMPVNHNVPKSKGYTFFKGPVFGAFHGADLSYAFDSLGPDTDRDWTDFDREVGDKTSTLWANFIKYGNPNGVTESERPNGCGEWPNAVNTPEMVYQVGNAFRAERTTSEEKIKFWEDFLSAQKAW
jgi:carboxylesterase type B